ncbi:retrovirus-related pol polyprotein from transposon TNT 1-94, partial [Tanacetum coccineum]
MEQIYDRCQASEGFVYNDFDQLHAYLEQHELHANEVHLLRERNQDLLAFVVSFAVPVFSPGDDLIACLNKAMVILTAVASSRVTVQQVQGRQGQSYFGTGYKSKATSSGRNNAIRQAKVVKCYNCQGKGHMARQCTQPKRLRNAAWYKDKAMLAEAQEAGQILNEEQLTEDLDTYDSNCDDISNAKAVLMANISNYGSDVISEVPHSESYLNDMENQ